MTDDFPGAELLKQRQVSRRDGTATRVGDALTTGLTSRQRTVLETAYHAGYYEWPRAVTGEAVAGSLGIAGPTFHQHLRKAEGRLIDAILGPARTD